MCQETLDLEKYAEEGLQKQKRIEEWKQQQDEGFTELNKVLAINSEQQETREVVSDLPKQKADEKEIWQKRRQRIQLHKMVKKANHSLRKGREEEPVSTFISENELTPDNVLNNFDDIIYRLAHYPDKNGTLYKRTKEAFETSVKILGYKCITKKDGSVEVERIWGKEKEETQEVNRKVQKSLKEEIEKYRADCNVKSEDYFQENLKKTRESFLKKIPENHPRIKAEEELKKLQNSWGGKYEGISNEDKQRIARIIDEYGRLGEVREHYYEVSCALEKSEETAKEKWDNLTADGVIAIYAKKRADIREKMSLLDKRSKLLLTLVDSTMEGKGAYKPEEKQLLNELGEKHRDIRMNYARNKSTCYAESYKIKEELLKQGMLKAGLKVDEEMVNKAGDMFMMFMKEKDEEHNKAVINALKLYIKLAAAGDTDVFKSKELGQLMKPILQPLIEQINDYDTEVLQRLDDGELVGGVEELQELGMINRQVLNMGKIIDPDDPQGRSITEVLRGNRARFEYKQKVIEQTALKSRCNAMIYAYKQGCLDESSFTLAELKEMGLSSENQVAERSKLFDFIREKWKTISISQKTIEVMRTAQRIKDFNTAEFFDCPDEVLLAHYQELKDICESLNPIENDVQLDQYGENFYNGDKALWKLKRDVMKLYYSRARFIKMKEDAEKGTLKPDSFTESERKEIRDKNGLDDQAPISEENMKAYIRETLDKQKNGQKLLYQKYYEAYGDEYAIFEAMKKKSPAEEWKPKVSHEGFVNEMEEVKEEVEKKNKEEAKKKIGTEARSNSSKQEPEMFLEYGEKLYDELVTVRGDIEELQQKNGDPKEILEQKEKEQEIVEKMEYVKILLQGPDENRICYKKIDNCVEELSAINKKITALQQDKGDVDKIRELEDQKQKIEKTKACYCEFLKFDKGKCYPKYENQLREELVKIQGSITDLQQNKGDVEKVGELKEQEQKIKRKLGYLNIILALKEEGGGKNAFPLADQEIYDQWVIPEGFNRAINTLHILPAFAKLSSEEFFEMFQKLFAGRRVKAKATPEEIEEYREENVEGLLTYKEYLIAHTKDLEKIYHFKLPSVEYLREHLEELKTMNSLTQLHSRMAYASREMFDLTKQEDRKLFYDVLVLSRIGTVIPHMLKGNLGEIKKPKTLLDIAEAEVNVQLLWNMLASTKQGTFDIRNKFLDAEEKRTEEEKQQEEQLDDRFRQLAKEATDILRRGNKMPEEERKELYRNFIDRADELQKYVEQNKSVGEVIVDELDYYSPEVLRMDQIRAWNHQVQKKRAILEARLKENE